MERILQLQEELMRRGWWDEAERMLHRLEFHPAERTLQGCLIHERRACVERCIQIHRQGIQPEKVFHELERYFDQYTILWTLQGYMGDGSELWRGRNEKASGPMD